MTLESAPALVARLAAWALSPALSPRTTSSLTLPMTPEALPWSMASLNELNMPSPKDDQGPLSGRLT